MSGDLMPIKCLVHSHWHPYTRTLTPIPLHSYPPAKVFGIDTFDMARAEQLLDKVTLLDRLPRQQSLAGLLLLRECWDEHDITMHLAGQYKRASHVMYVVLLMLGLVILVLVSVQTRVKSYYDIERAVSSVANASDSDLSKARFTA